MQTTIVVCPQCPRVVAVGTVLSATCYAAVPENERTGGPTAMDAHPSTHHNCQQLEVMVPDGLYGAELISELERLYADQIAALHTLG